jgi:type III restriction enzyme
MPEACHYGNDFLDGCYLYTFDERFTAGVIGSIDDLNVGVRKLIIKSAHKKFALVKEQRTMISETRDPQQALSVISGRFRRKYKLGKDLSQNRIRLETAGYVFGEDVVSSTVSGDASTIGGLKSANRSMNVVSIRVPVNTHRHGREFHHCIGEIGAASALPYDEMRTIVHRVFGTKPSDVAKCLRLEAKELYAFVINNVKRLRDDVGEAISEELNLTKDSGKVSEKEFRFPQEWFCAYDTNARNKEASGKNVYAGYPLAAATTKMRSKGEVKFEKWCEKSGCVEWYYRNGDKGDEYFSIVYSDNSGQQRLFYPDYIVECDGKIWIVEVKGGWTAGGKSENIDEYAEKKALALRRYCEKYGVQGGFICYDESEDELLLNEEGYSEDLTDKSWKPL